MFPWLAVLTKVSCTESATPALELLGTDCLCVFCFVVAIMQHSHNVVYQILAIYDIRNNYITAPYSRCVRSLKVVKFVEWPLDNLTN